MNLLKTGYIGNIFLWSITFEPLICKSDFNIIFLLQSMTAKAKQNPEVNILQRCCHNRFSKAKNETSECSLPGSLSLKISGRIGSSEIETLLFLYPIANGDVASLSSQQCVFLGTGSGMYSCSTLWGKVHSESFQLSVLSFPRRTFEITFDIFGLLHLKRGGRGPKLARTSLSWASLVLIEWKTRGAG